MPDRTCVVCAEPLAPERRSDATICSNACSSWKRKHPGIHRPRGERSYTCEHCDGQFTRPKLHSAKRPRFCSDACWEAFRHRQRPFGEWRVPEPYSPRVFTCQDCGSAAKDSGIGPAASRCPSCLVLRERQLSLQWQRDHPDLAAQRKAAWTAANPEKVQASRERNREATAAQQRIYQALNRDRVREWKRDRENRRRAIKAATTVVRFRALDIFDRDGWICGICNQPVDPAARFPDWSRASLDHVIPLSRGGPHTPTNAQLAHLSCNVRKGAALP